MSDEEEDYMSDKFLLSNESSPSLIKDRAKKRQVAIAVKQAELMKRQRQERLDRTDSSRNEKLQESLSRPIEVENKGYQLLAKMGYKPGQALGKSATDTNDAKSLLEPIGISIKLDRFGLGREAALRELAERRLQLRKERLLRAAGGERVTAEEFRRRSMQKAEERFFQGALRRCQLSCESLDLEGAVKEPEMVWFWPERPTELAKDNVDESVASSSDGEVDEDEADIDEYSDMEKVEMLTSYLRTSYQFCFWCGVRYKDLDDLNSNCPGITRDDH